MSCAPEWKLSAYADGDLAPAELRALEAHLVGCAQCRRTVIALRGEARVLRDLVHERLPEPAPLATAGHGVALGLPLAVAALALVSIGAGALAEALPRELAWIAPTKNLGVTQMLFALVFGLRERAAAWFDFAFALTALASAAALAYFVADTLLRRVRVGGRGVASLLLLALLSALAPRPAQAAFEVRHAGEVVIDAATRIDGSLFASGDTVSIDGTIAGDLIAAGGHVAIRGTVEGNVFCAGGEVELTGEVKGSLHCAGGEVRVEAAIGGAFYAAGREVVLRPGTRVSGDAALAGRDLKVEGNLARDLLAAGKNVVIAGQVGRDATVHAENLSLRDTAAIAGKLEMHLPRGAEPGIAKGATHGPILRVDLDRDARVGVAPLERFHQIKALLWRVLEVAGAFVVGLILYALAPGLFAARVETTGRFFVSLGLGFATLILIPCALVLLVMSILGIPIAGLGALGLVVVAYVGPIVLAAAIGRSVMRPAGASFREFGISLLVGLLLLGVLVSLPVIGRPAFVIVVFAGTGLLVLHLYELWSARRAASPAPA